MNMLSAFIPVFDLLNALLPKLEDGTAEDFEPTSQQFLDALFNAHKILFDQGHLPVNINNAVFAICSLVDERVLESQWQHRAEWQKTPLQMRLYNTNRAGSEFFVRLDSLNESSPEQQEVREIYLYCLKQGFSGCYFEVGEQSRLDEIIQANYLLLSRAISLQLFDPVVESQIVDVYAENQLERFKESAKLWAPVVAVVGTFLFLRAEIFTTISETFSGT